MAEKKAERIKEIKTAISTLTHEYDTLTKKRGICSQCGEEAEFANWGAAHDLVCQKCHRKNEIAKAREKWGYLVGLRVEDLITEPGWKPLQGFKLEGGYTIEIDTDRDGDSWLDVEHRASKTKLVSLEIPKHHITDRRWTNKYKQHIGDALLRKCINALRARATGVVIVQLKELPDEVRKFLKEDP